MTDNITMPREVVKLALEALEWSWGGEPMGTKEREAITALRTHLAAEQPKPEPVAVFDEQMGHPVLLLGSPMLKDKQPLYTAPPALAAEQPKPEPVVWWDVNKPLDYLTRCENGTTFHNRVIMPRHAVAWAYTNSPEDEALRRDAERYRWLRDNAAGFSGRTLDAVTDAAIDAAMGDRT